MTASLPGPGCRLADRPGRPAPDPSRRPVQPADPASTAAASHQCLRGPGPSGGRHRAQHPLPGRHAATAPGQAHGPARPGPSWIRPQHRQPPRGNANQPEGRACTTNASRHVRSACRPLGVGCSTDRRRPHSHRQPPEQQGPRARRQGSLLNQTQRRPAPLPNRPAPLPRPNWRPCGAVGPRSHLPARGHCQGGRAGLLRPVRPRTRRPGLPAWMPPGLRGTGRRRSSTTFITIHNMATWMLGTWATDAVRAEWGEPSPAAASWPATA
jgi:hypothetical protein